MDYVDLVQQAGKGDVNAFVALTRRFQRRAFGAALALVHDVQSSEDGTQDAFLAVWPALSTPGMPAALPGRLHRQKSNLQARFLCRSSIDPPRWIVAFSPKSSSRIGRSQNSNPSSVSCDRMRPSC